MKLIFAFLVALGITLSGCTYNVVQQQGKTHKNSAQSVGIDRHGNVQAYQGPAENIPTYSPPVTDYSSSSNEYSGTSFPRSAYGGYYGYYGAPIAPAYAPDDGGIPYPLPIRSSSFPVRSYYEPAIHARLNLY